MSQQKKNKRKPRRQRRRIHRGRMVLVCSVAALLIIALMAVFSRSCGTECSIVRGGGDFRKPIPTAIERGHADARKVLETAPGSMERQGALLYIRATEHRLRKAGHAHAADDYLNAATDLLRTHGALSTDTI